MAEEITDSLTRLPPLPGWAPNRVTAGPAWSPTKKHSNGTPNWAGALLWTTLDSLDHKGQRATRQIHWKTARGNLQLAILRFIGFQCRPVQTWALIGVKVSPTDMLLHLFWNNRQGLRPHGLPLNDVLRFLLLQRKTLKPKSSS